MVYRTRCVYCGADALNVGDYLPALCADCARRSEIKVVETASSREAAVVRDDGKRVPITGLPSQEALDRLLPDMERSLETMRH